MRCFVRCQFLRLFAGVAVAACGADAEQGPSEVDQQSADESEPEPDAADDDPEADDDTETADDDPNETDDDADDHNVGGADDTGDSNDSTDDEGSGGDDDAAPGVSDDLDSCSLPLLDTTEPVAGHATCLEIGEDMYECSCREGESEEPMSRSAESCQAALVELCGLEQRDLATCDHDDYGICRPRDELGSEWDCLCDGSDELSLVTEVEDCSEAAFTACAAACASDTGACEPSADSLFFDCNCELYGERHVSWDGYACDQLLENSCEPGHGLGQWGACTSETGYCDQPDPAVGTWACQCLDGSSREVSPEPGQEGDSEIDCGVALRLVCGGAAPQSEPGERCERETSAGRVRCQASSSGDPDAVEDGHEYACSCSMVCEDSAGDSGGSVFAESCDAAMDVFCGVNGPTCDDEG